MPRDFLTRNMVESIEISDEDLASLPEKDTFCKSIKILQTEVPWKLKTKNGHQKCWKL